MTGWVHVRVWGSGECDGQSTDDPRVPCGCTTPDPDPTSPCGFVPCGEGFVTNPHECWCRFHPKQFVPGSGRPGHHPHVPTLCRCGHRIEEVP